MAEVVPAHPEVVEPEDQLVTEGLSSGRAAAGRKALAGRRRAPGATLCALAVKGRRGLARPHASHPQSRSELVLWVLTLLLIVHHFQLCCVSGLSHEDYL